MTRYFRFTAVKYTYACAKCHVFLTSANTFIFCCIPIIFHACLVYRIPFLRAWLVLESNFSKKNKQHIRIWKKYSLAFELCAATVKIVLRIEINFELKWITLKLENQENNRKSKKSRKCWSFCSLNLRGFNIHSIRNNWS